MEKIVSLCKRRGFIFQSSEIYGGLSNTWDYGPYGVELKNNLKRAWWKANVYERDDIYGMDAAILMHPKVWQASGHVENFFDLKSECASCNKRFKAADLKDKFKPVVVHKFDVPKDFKIIPNIDFTYNSITTGSEKAQNNQNNDIAGREFNLKSFYTTPVNPITSDAVFTTKLNIRGTDIQLLMNDRLPFISGNSGSLDQTSTKQNQLDNEIFLISSFMDGEQITSRGTELFSVCIDEVTGSVPEIPINLELTPRRIFGNWASIIQSGLDKFNNQYIRFNHADIVCKLRTRLLTEDTDIVEQSDILISDLTYPYFSGNRLQFSERIKIDDILSIIEFPDGLHEVYDPIRKKYTYGWNKEISTQPIDKLTNCDLYEVSDEVLVIAQKSKFKLLSGGYFKLLSGDYMNLLNQN